VPQTYSWADERERAAEAFGGRYPDAELEQDLIEAFRDRPAFVVDAINDVIGGYEAGRITSPWPFLRKRIAEPAADVVVSDTRERDKRVAQAQGWIRSTGLHFEQESELVDELFGSTGRLRGWDSAPLREEMLSLWRQVRPAGEQLECEAEDRIKAQVDALERVDGHTRRTSRPRNADGSFVSPLDVDDWAAV